MKKVKLEHGAGGELMEEFIKNLSSLIKLKSTKNGRGLDKLEDAGIATIGKIKIALTTDSYTVKPIFFPGGNIGKLAVCGTINDLAVMGAEPIALSVSYILEEGFDVKYLEKITTSISRTSHLIGVPIITGDTKVMEHGKIDNIVINTSGIGVVKKLITNDGARVGDKIIVSGSVGEHGIVLLANRFNFHTSLKSDCACVLDLVREVLKIGG
ncbi:MAG: AIR synthase related protein, partial [Candidatus Aenigmarchaeota archaeon]|nr:AIR synthase related protein [Candidatus Aenigmarchaeota archaeon]